MADADNYAIKIKDLALFVRNVLLSPVVRMGHVKAFEKTSCKYPIRRVEALNIFRLFVILSLTQLYRYTLFDCHI